MRNHSRSHKIIEVHPHDAPEVGIVQPLEPPELLVPQVNLAIQALNPIV